MKKILLTLLAISSISAFASEYNYQDQKIFTSSSNNVCTNKTEKGYNPITVYVTLPNGSELTYNTNGSSDCDTRYATDLKTFQVDGLIQVKTELNSDYSLKTEVLLTEKIITRDNKKGIISRISVDNDKAPFVINNERYSNCKVLGDGVTVEKELPTKVVVTCAN